MLAYQESFYWCLQMHDSMVRHPNFELYCIKCIAVATFLRNAATAPLPTMASHHLHANGTHSIQPPGTTSHTPHQAIANIANGKPATVPFIADADFVAGTVHHTAHHSQHRHTCKHNPSLLAVLTTTGWPLHAYMQPCTAEFEGSTVHANFPPPHSASNRPSCSRHPQFVTDTIAKYVAQGALFTWGSTQEPPPYITMPLHVAQDPKLRLCYDAGYLNMFTRAMPFRLDTLVDMSATLSPHQPTLLSSFDMKAWYLQHRLHPLSCLLVGIEWHGTRYLYLHPAFGLKLSGYMCDQQPSELCSILRHNMLASHEGFPELHLVLRLGHTAASCECH